jgi:hypothetical protein
MSFIDTLSKIASGTGNFLSSNSLGSQLAKTALYGLALAKVSKSIQKQQDKGQLNDQGIQVTVNPDPKNSIPVIYGTAFTSGILTDAHMMPDNLTMWFCITVSEMTGNLINGTPSTFQFNEVYYNGLRLDFRNDGFTVDRAYDDTGNSTDKMSGLIAIYPFVNGSNNPVGFTTEGSKNTANATSLFPSWTSSDQMSGLVFALVRVTYDAKQRISSVGDFKFKINNSMKLPGDVLNDYMQNTRYGAGIPAAEINIS